MATLTPACPAELRAGLGVGVTLAGLAVGRIGRSLAGRVPLDLRCPTSSGRRGSGAAVMSQCTAPHIADLS
jgi:hypothetical protein